MSREVPRIGRVLDALGLLLFLGGAAVYLWTWMELRAMDRFQRAPGDALFAAVERADHVSMISRIGAGIMAAGVLVFVIAAVIARRGSRQPDS